MNNPLAIELKKLDELNLKLTPLAALHHKILIFIQCTKSPLVEQRSGRFSVQTTHKKNDALELLKNKFALLQNELKETSEETVQNMVMMWMEDSKLRENITADLHHIKTLTILFSNHLSKFDALIKHFFEYISIKPVFGTLDTIVHFSKFASPSLEKLIISKILKKEIFDTYSEHKSINNFINSL